MAKIKKLNITEIEDGLKKVINNINLDTFIEEFLSLYEIPKTSITRAKKNLNDGKDFIIKNRLFYREVSEEVVLAVDSIEQEILGDKSQPRYIIATDFYYFAAVDTKTRETLNIPIEEVPSNADFFLAWNGIEKADYQAESPADRKAAERFAKLYDVVARDNPNANEHAFNLFLIRTLFLLFAEDTGIIDKGLFTNVLKTRTSDDGSNFNIVIKELFEILDISQQNRKDTPDWLIDFPYVNGKLFGEPHVNLAFSKKSRELLIEAGELLNWNEINPDILGAMIQSVASEEDRHVSGMHYTSVSNITKVINPLFLNELTEDLDSLENAYKSNESSGIKLKRYEENKINIIKKLNLLNERISNIKFLDPACGSGNFLIITYKKLRRLEIEILLLIQRIENIDAIPMSKISLNQFYGIELDDFAHEVAKLSLWIAEHQMNEEMVERMPSSNAVLLPLKDAGNIVQSNALQIEWTDVLSYNKVEEIYIMGNPPYLGASLQSKEQKKDMETVFGDRNGYKDFDYILGWFIKGAEFLKKTNGVGAFVTTNSITHGKPIAVFWPYFFETFNEIKFAHTSFKWRNSAKNNAGVTVVIIGFADINKAIEKKIYTSTTVMSVDNITPYLTSGKNILVKNSTKSISNLPEINIGSAMLDNDFFKITEENFREFSNKYPEHTHYFHKLIGSKELIQNTFRWTLVLSDDQVEEAVNNPIIKKKLESVENYRLSSKRKSTQEMARYPWRFGENRRQEKTAIVIPKTSSENRLYVPMGIYSKDYVLSDATFAVYDAPIWLLGLLESRMHMVWLRSIGGKLKTDYRYSAGLVYNTFPIKSLSTQRKNEIERVTTEMLDLREYEGGTLADLYNKETMPETLRIKHEELDGIIDRAYRQKPFESDEERLFTLLELYREMQNDEGK